MRHENFNYADRRQSETIPSVCEARREITGTQGDIHAGWQVNEFSVTGVSLWNLCNFFSNLEV